MTGDPLKRAITRLRRKASRYRRANQRAMAVKVKQRASLLAQLVREMEK